MNDTVPDGLDRRSRGQACTGIKYLPCGSIVIEPGCGPCALDDRSSLGVPDVETRTDADALNLTTEKNIRIG